MELTVMTEAVPHRDNPESSLDLLERARRGDRAALEALCARYRPRLERWAHGRLPPGARSASDTQDLVQDTLLQMVNSIESFEPRHEAALPAFLHTVLLNRLRDQIRRSQRRPVTDPIDSQRETADPSPLEQAIGTETLERYEAALERLRPEDREAIIMNVELGLSHAEVAQALQKPSIAAARMAVSRALVKLAEQMAQSASERSGIRD